MGSSPTASHFRHISRLVVLTGIGLVVPGIVATQPVAVRHAEGSVHAMLALRASDGTLLADGVLEQSASGDRVTSQLTFRFQDGSIQEQTTVFSQQGRFRLISDRLVQKGPTFNRPLEMTIDTTSGQVTVTYVEGGKEQTAQERLDLPDDLANGMLPVLLKNLDPASPPSKVSLVAATPRPRLVGLRLSAAGPESLTLTGATHRAVHYVVKAEIGGIAGTFAPLVGKQPPDVHVWVLAGDPSAFLKSEGPLFYGGAPWRIELTSPVSPAER